jgi:hypothetical protein
MSKQYVIVTAVSQFRMRYCIPVDDLRAENPDPNVVFDPVEWAKDSVTCNEVEEFSQLHLGETIIDGQVLTQEEMLNLFNKDNDYLTSWTEEQKIDHVHRWKQDNS